MNTNSYTGAEAPHLLICPASDAQAVFNMARFCDRRGSGRRRRAPDLQEEDSAPQDLFSRRRAGLVVQGPWLGPVALDSDQGETLAPEQAPVVVHLACSLMGPQHPDLVDLVTRTIDEAHASIQDSRMTVLGSEFAMLVLLSVEDRHRRALESGMEELAHRFRLGLMVQATSRPGSYNAGTGLYVEASGVDREGIVRALAACLTEQGVQVEDMEARVTPPRGPSVPLATIRLKAQVPQDVCMEVVKEGLQRLAAARNLEVQVRSASTPARSLGAWQPALAF